MHDDRFSGKDEAVLERLARKHILSSDGNYCALRKTMSESGDKPTGGGVFYMMAYVFLPRHVPFLTDFEQHYNQYWHATKTA